MCVEVASDNNIIEQRLSTSLDIMPGLLRGGWGSSSWRLDGGLYWTIDRNGTFELAFNLV
jgi:hypothetical protein